MLSTARINVPMNRVEGDLEVTAELKDGVVEEAWVSGTMYRGFERILVGRGARDGLVITPRVCGMCSTSHLSAAAQALDAITGTAPPPDALRVRNLVLATEHLQSDMRHLVLYFAADFTNPAWDALPLYEEAVRRFAPLRGEMVIEAIQETRKLLDIVAILGGQWPHSCYMVPGGVVSVPSGNEILQCKLVLNRFRDWYERRVLGCTLDRWSTVRSDDDLSVWLDERPQHRDGLLGFFVRFCRAAGLDRIGKSHGNYLSFGGIELPGWGGPKGARLSPAGLAEGPRVLPFSQDLIGEHVSHSWFADYEGAKHPSVGETQPYATGNEGKKYSWAKAPRYDGKPVETGPLAEMVVGRQPLITDLVRRGSNVFVRQLARVLRPAWLLPVMERYVAELDPGGSFYEPAGEIPDGVGAGLIDASRGALGHWVSIRDGRIESYQIITPTAWNASPRDSAGVRGPMEEALVGTVVKDPENPLELGHIVRSFDPCLVCTVHAVRKGRRSGVTIRVQT